MLQRAISNETQFFIAYPPPSSIKIEQYIPLKFQLRAVAKADQHSEKILLGRVATISKLVIYFII